MVINCSKFVEEEIKNLKTQFFDLIKNKDIKPCLYIINTTENSGSLSYIKSKIKLGIELGVQVEVVHFKGCQNQLLELINSLNNNDLIHGIIVQLPLANNLEKEVVINAISPLKDVDCLTDANKASFYTKHHYDNNDLIPATAKGIWQLLRWVTNNHLSGLDVSIINRSELVGKPLFWLLNAENCTTTLCHSQTKSLKEKLKQSDVIVSGMSTPLFISVNDVKKNAILIDVSINRLNNRLVGDAKFDELINHCQITPVPKGVGPITVSQLFNNLLVLINRQKKTNH